MCPICMATIALCAGGGASAAGLVALVAKVTRASDGKPGVGPKNEVRQQGASP